MVSSDLNRRRKGKKVKQLTFDTEFLFDPLKGPTVGYVVATLVNLSNLSVVDVRSFSNKTSKQEMWQMVNNLGTKTSGKVKTVIADAGFCTYKLYEVSMSNRIIPIIKPKKNMEVEKVIQSMPINLDWLDPKYSSIFDELVRDLNEIISFTLEAVNNYEDFAEMRAEIEMLFKASKALFGLKDIHIYYRDLAMPRFKMCLYTGSIFMQFCYLNRLHADVIIEHLRRRNL